MSFDGFVTFALKGSARCMIDSDLALALARDQCLKHMAAGISYLPKGAIYPDETFTEADVGGQEIIASTIAVPFVARTTARFIIRGASITAGGGKVVRDEESVLKERLPQAASGKPYVQA